MSFQVSDIGVFCLLFPLIRFMDQDVEAVGLRITLENTLELLFMQFHQFLYGAAERFQKFLGDPAIRQGADCSCEKLRLPIQWIHLLVLRLTFKHARCQTSGRLTVRTACTNIYLKMSGLASRNRDSGAASCYVSNDEIMSSYWFRSFFFALPLMLTLSAQTPELASEDAPVIFRSTSNLIPVPVVVRDSKGQAVGNLSIDDFQLFDNGKPQAISKFAVEKLGEEEVAPAVPSASQAAPPGAPPVASENPATAGQTPERFVAYLFDDLHLNLADLVRTRDAAQRQMDSTLNPKLRVAIYTTSGRQNLEFTGDREKLHSVLNAINAGYAAAARSSQQNSCPQMDFYMGDLIYNKDDASALKIAAQDALACLNLPSPAAGVSEGDVRTCEGPHEDTNVCRAVESAKRSARLAVQEGDRDTEFSLSAMRAVISRMTSMPGKRTVVLISPGFLVLNDRHQEEMALVERAIKASVVIGGLDARGLYSQSPGGGASDRVGNPQTMTAKLTYETALTQVQADVVANLAEGTGGSFFHGTNDFDEGVARAAATPQYLYVLGFSPQDLKLDGKFHTLKVTLKNQRGYDLQVRKGYYAATASTGPEEKAKQQIEDAFFSRDEIHDLPAVLQTQYFKLDNGDVTLSAVTKIDAKKLAFRKDNDRNRDDVTVVTGIFDSDGNYISGQQKVLQMRFLDRTLQTRLGSGISVEHNFTVHPGRYTVRMVIRDTEGQSMSAQSTLVDIP